MCQAPGNPVLKTLVTVLPSASFSLPGGKMVIRSAIETKHDELIVGTIHLLFVRGFLLPYQSAMDFRRPLFVFFFPVSLFFKEYVIFSSL